MSAELNTLVAVGYTKDNVKVFCQILFALFLLTERWMYKESDQWNKRQNYPINTTLGYSGDDVVLTKNQGK